MNEEQALFERYINGNISAQEERELLQLLADKNNGQLRESLVDHVYDSLADDYMMDPQQADAIFHAIVQTKQTAPLRKIRSYKSWWAAAAVLVVFSLGSYIYFNRTKTVKPDIVQADNQPTDVAAPAANRATIQLANGQLVYLDSAGNGALATQGNIRLVKLSDGSIVYETADGQVLKEMQYNTLSNPRGSRAIDMKLSDGSHVWLNAGSSITYPVAFVDNERKVSMQGEAYFEIMHDAARPFTVSKGAMEVKVLGTRFNVNAFDDEPNIKVTLLQGSVKVNTARKSSLLRPGQQAAIDQTGGLKIASSADLEQVMAWKNGQFDFGENTSLKEIMREVSRWYDVEIIYEDDLEEAFGGSISRQANVSGILKRFELTGRLHYRITGKKIILKK